MANNKKAVKNPLKNALHLKTKQNISKSPLAKGVKLPAKASVKSRMAKRSTKIRKS